MPNFQVEIIRRFYVSDVVSVKAKSMDEALEIAQRNYDKFKSEIPDIIFDYLDFEESEINPYDD